MKSSRQLLKNSFLFLHLRAHDHHVVACIVVRHCLSLIHDGAADALSSLSIASIRCLLICVPSVILLLSLPRPPVLLLTTISSGILPLWLMAEGNEKYGYSCATCCCARESSYASQLIL